MKRILTYALIAPLVLACSGNAGHGDTVSEAQPQQLQQTQGEDAPSRSVTTKLPVSKGTIRSDREVKVFSTIEGQLLEVKLIEGQRVSRGEQLFKLDDSEIADRIALCESEYEQAVLRMQEILIGQGYKRDSLDLVPEKYKEYARIKSGVNVKERELALNRDMLRRTTVTASQSGLITGIDALSYDFVKQGKTLCTIVDPSRLIVEFSILETEMRRFSVGTDIEVRAIAYPDVAHHASVRSIGTVVDAGGMIKVEALLSDVENLIPGMTAIINL